MPIQVDQHFVLQTPQGQTLILSKAELEAAKMEADFTFQCSSRRCASRHSQDQPITFSWRMEPGKVPDALFQTITIMVDPVEPKEFVFCGPACARDWLVYEYLPPLAKPSLTSEQLAGLNSSEFTGNPPVQKTDSEALNESVGAHSLPEPIVIGQADGSGE